MVSRGRGASVTSLALPTSIPSFDRTVPFEFCTWPRLAATRREEGKCHHSIGAIVACNSGGQSGEVGRAAGNAMPCHAGTGLGRWTATDRQTVEHRDGASPRTIIVLPFAMGGLDCGLFPNHLCEADSQPRMEDTLQSLRVDPPPPPAPLMLS